MEASAISHLAICTRDMEKSLAFYRDMLGMKVLFDGPKEAGGPAYPHVGWGIEPAPATGAHGRSGGRSRAIVSCTINPPGFAPPPPRPVAAGGGFAPPPPRGGGWGGGRMGSSPMTP